MKTHSVFLGLVAGLSLAACTPPADSSLVVYSARSEQLIKPVFDLYEQETGIRIDFVTDKAEVLMQRLIAEGKNSPADLLITVDAGNLWHAAGQGLFQPVASSVLEANIPAHLRDTGKQWFGISVRARTIVYDPAAVSRDELVNYFDLAKPKWKGRLCLRTSKKVYNQSLVAMLIAQHGEQETEAVVRSWVDNLATDVFPDDTRLMKAILAGQCQLGVVNSYYFGRLQKAQPDLRLALFWPAASDGGVHVNVAGAGVTRFAPHREQAIAFLEWLSQPTAQAVFASVDMEFPANPAIDPDPLVAAWGAFEASPVDVVSAGELQADAVRLMDRAGYH
ncbi:MAG: extracellular solute-binding protein [Proteobacteria bacterium]|nr:extracellular solute-binding protein [Pseudomonadota bacterium]